MVLENQASVTVSLRNDFTPKTAPLIQSLKNLAKESDKSSISVGSLGESFNLAGSGVATLSEKLVALGNTPIRLEDNLSGLNDLASGANQVSVALDSMFLKHLTGAKEVSAITTKLGNSLSPVQTLMDTLTKRSTNAGKALNLVGTYGDGLNNVLNKLEGSLVSVNSKLSQVPIIGQLATGSIEGLINTLNKGEKVLWLGKVSNDLLTMKENAAAMGSALSTALSDPNTQMAMSAAKPMLPYLVLGQLANQAKKLPTETASVIGQRAIDRSLDKVGTLKTAGNMGIDIANTMTGAVNKVFKTELPKIEARFLQTDSTVRNARLKSLESKYKAAAGDIGDLAEKIGAAEIRSKALISLVGKIGSAYLLFGPLLKTIPQVVNSLNNVRYSVLGVTQAFETMANMGIDTTMAQLATNLGLVGEGLIGNYKTFESYSVNLYRDAEKQATLLQTLSAVWGKSTDSLIESTDKVNKKLSNFALNTKELFVSIYDNVSAGLSLKKAQEQSVLIGKFANATLANADQLNKVVTNAVNLTGLTVDKVLAQFNATIQGGIMSSQQFNEVATDLISGLGLLKRPLQETLGLLAEGSKQKPVETIALQLRRASDALSSFNESQNEFLAQYGQSVNLQLLQEKGVVQVVKDMDKSFGGSIEKWQKLIPEVNAFAGVMAILKMNTKDYAETVKKIGESSSIDTDKVFEKSQETIEARITRIQNGFESVFTDFGKRFKDAPKPALDAMEGILKYLQEMPEPVKNFIGLIIQVQKQFEKVGTIVSSIVGVVTTLAGAIFGVLVMFRGGQLFSGFMKGFQDVSAQGNVFKKVLFGVRDAIKEAIGVQVEWNNDKGWAAKIDTTNTWGKALKGTIDTFGTVKSKATDAYKFIFGEEVQKDIKKSSSMIDGFMSLLKSVLTIDLKSGKKSIKDQLFGEGTIVSGFEKIFSSIKDKAIAFKDWLSKSTGEGMDMKEMMSNWLKNNNVFNQGLRYSQLGVAGLRSAFKGLAGIVTSVGKMMLTALPIVALQAASALAQDFVVGFGGAADTAHKFAEEVKDASNNTVYMTESTEKLFTQIKENAGDATKEYKSATNQLISFGKMAINFFWDLIQQITKGISWLIKKIPGIGNALGGVLDGVVDFSEGMQKNFNQSITMMQNSIEDLVNSEAIEALGTLITRTQNFVLYLKSTTAKTVASSPFRGVVEESTKDLNTLSQKIAEAEEKLGDSLIDKEKRKLLEDTYKTALKQHSELIKSKKEFDAIIDDANSTGRTLNSEEVSKLNEARAAAFAFRKKEVDQEIALQEAKYEEAKDIDKAQAARLKEYIDKLKEESANQANVLKILEQQQSALNDFAVNVEINQKQDSVGLDQRAKGITKLTEAANKATDPAIAKKLLDQADAWGKYSVAIGNITNQSMTELESVKDRIAKTVPDVDENTKAIIKTQQNAVDSIGKTITGLDTFAKKLESSGEGIGSFQKRSLVSLQASLKGLASSLTSLNDNTKEFNAADFQSKIDGSIQAVLTTASQFADDPQLTKAVLDTIETTTVAMRSGTGKMIETSLKDALSPEQLRAYIEARLTLIDGIVNKEKEKLDKVTTILKHQQDIGQRSALDTLTLTEKNNAKIRALQIKAGSDKLELIKKEFGVESIEYKQAFDAQQELLRQHKSEMLKAQEDIATERLNTIKKGLDREKVLIERSTIDGTNAAEEQRLRDNQRANITAEIKSLKDQLATLPKELVEKRKEILDKLAQLENDVAKHDQDDKLQKLETFYDEQNRIVKDKLTVERLALIDGANQAELAAINESEIAVAELEIKSLKERQKLYADVNSKEYKQLTSQILAAESELANKKLNAKKEALQNEIEFETRKRNILKLIQDRSTFDGTTYEEFLNLQKTALEDATKNIENIQKELTLIADTGSKEYLAKQEELTKAVNDQYRLRTQQLKEQLEKQNELIELSLNAQKIKQSKAALDGSTEKELQDAAKLGQKELEVKAAFLKKQIALYQEGSIERLKLENELADLTVNIEKQAIANKEEIQERALNKQKDDLEDRKAKIQDSIKGESEYSLKIMHDFAQADLDLQIRSLEAKKSKYEEGSVERIKIESDLNKLLRQKDKERLDYAKQVEDHILSVKKASLEKQKIIISQMDLTGKTTESVLANQKVALDELRLNKEDLQKQLDRVDKGSIERLKLENEIAKVSVDIKRQEIADKQELLDRDLNNQKNNLEKRKLEITSSLKGESEINLKIMQDLATQDLQLQIRSLEAKKQLYKQGSDERIAIETQLNEALINLKKKAQDDEMALIEFAQSMREKSTELAKIKLQSEFNDLTKSKQQYDEEIHKLDLEANKQKQQDLLKMLSMYKVGTKEYADYLLQLKQIQLQYNEEVKRKQLADLDLIIDSINDRAEDQRLKADQELRSKEQVIKLLDEEKSIKESINSINKSQRDIEIEFLELSKSKTKDLVKQADIEIQIKERQVKNQKLESDLQRQNLENEKQVFKLNNAVEKSKLRQQLLENQKQIAELDLQIQKARLSNDDKEVRSLMRQLEATKDSAVALRQQELSLDRQQKVQEQVLSNKETELTLQQQLTEERSKIDIEIAKQQKIIALIDKRKDQIALAGEIATASLDKELKMRDQLNQIEENKLKQLERRRSEIDSILGALDSMSSIAQEEAVSDAKKRYLAKEQAKIKYDALKLTQEMERETLRLQQKQTEEAIKRREIELSRAKLQAEIELKQSELDASKVLNDEKASKEEKIRALELIKLRREAVESYGTSMAQLQEEYKAAKESGRLSERSQQLTQKVADISARRAISKTTINSADDFGIGIEATNELRTLITQFTEVAKNKVQPTLGLNETNLINKIIDLGYNNQKAITDITNNLGNNKNNTTSLKLDRISDKLVENININVASGEDISKGTDVRDAIRQVLGEAIGRAQQIPIQLTP